MKSSYFFLSFIIVCLVWLFSFSSLIQAATATISANTTATRSAVDRVKEILEETEQIQNQRKRRALVGMVERVTTESLSLKTLKGEQIIKLLPEKTTILSTPKPQPMQVQDIEIGGYAIVMGYVNSDDVIEARRILVSSTILFPPKKKIVLGTVQNISSSTLTLLTRMQKEEKISLSKKTVYEDKQGESLKRTEVREDDEVLVIFRNADDASASATVVTVLQ
ncbi:MAG: hypothetical protein HZA34_00245 [Candidatus Pacebacteria bacterium]|nr:hypothetical protein [Candidatus Paceibacterota bacterium]